MRQVLHTFGQYSTAIQAIASVIQGLSAVVIVFLTAKLFRATRQYAELTRDSLSVAQQQFAREWLPQLHLSLYLADRRAVLRIANLSKHSVVISHLFIRVEKARQPNTFDDVDLAVQGASEAELWDITRYVRAALESHSKEDAWQGVMFVAVGFSLLNIPRPSPWVAYRITWEKGYITSAVARRQFVSWQPQPV